jgi:hypothetical protein
MTPASPAPTQMSKGSKRFLTGYLLGATILALYLVYSLWSAEPVVDRGDVPKMDCGGATTPVLKGLYPNRVDVGSTTSVVLILGCGFAQQTTQVKFNGAPHMWMPATSVSGSSARTSQRLGRQS